MCSLVHVLCLQTRKSKQLDPVKLSKKAAGWASVAQAYVGAMNKTLKTPVSKRGSAFDEMMTRLNPPKAVVDIMRKSDYIDGTLVVWRRKQEVFSPTEGKPGHLTCACCGTSHSFGRLDRVLIHLMSKNHHAKCREQDEALSKARSKEVLDEHCKASTSE